MKHFVQAIIFFFVSYFAFSQNPVAVTNVQSSCPFPYCGYGAPGFYIAPDGGDGSHKTVTVGNAIYFVGYEIDHGYALWKYITTTGEYTLVKDPYPGSNSDIAQITNIVAVGNNVYFTTTTNIQSDVYDIYMTDGTTIGTTLLFASNDSEKVNVSTFQKAGSYIYFGTYNGGDAYLYSINGNTVTQLKQFNSGSTVVGIAPIMTASYGGYLFFRGYDAATGMELWRSDGTPGGTGVFADMASNSQYSLNASGFQDFAEANGQLFFTGVIDTWGIDDASGTPHRIIRRGLFKMISPSSAPELFYDYDKNDEINGNHIEATFYSFAQQNGPAVLNGVFFYRGLKQLGSGPAAITISRGLARTDGTAAGTYLVEEFTDDTKDVSTEISKFNNKIIFRLQEASGPSLWLTDGTMNGAYKIGDKFVNSGNIGRFHIKGNRLYSPGYYDGIAHAGNSGIWSTDGTNSGTVILTPDCYATSPLYYMFESVGDSIYFPVQFNGCANNYQLNRFTIPTKIWLGKNSTAWNDGNNWDPVGIPTGADDIVVPGGIDNYPIVSSNAVARNLWINWGSVSIASGVQLTVNGELSAVGNLTGDGTLVMAAAGNDNLHGQGTIDITSVVINGSDVTLKGNKELKKVSFLSDNKIFLDNNNLVVTDNANPVSGYNANRYFVTDSTGSLTLKNIDEAGKVFPLGYSSVLYNPITITNGGGDDFSVRVQHDFSFPVANAGKAINAEWVISKSGSASGNNVTITPGWAAVSEAGYPSPTFHRTDALVLGHYNGTEWEEIPASGVIGSDPFTTTVTGVSSFSPFGVGNPGAFSNSSTVPVVNSFSPSEGYSGTTVTITGSNFTGVTAVTIGGVAVASFIVESPTTITAIVGAGATGNITVNTAEGAASSTQNFTYNGYISKAAGFWNDGNTWLGGNVPPAGATVSIDNNSVIINSNLVNTGTITVNSGQTLQCGATLTNNGTITINGTFQLNDNGSVVNNSLVYNGGISRLTYSVTTAQTTTDIEFPLINGPASLLINISNPYGLTLNGNKVIKGGLIFSGSGRLELAGNALTFEGGNIFNLVPLNTGMINGVSDGSTIIFSNTSTIAISGALIQVDRIIFNGTGNVQLSPGGPDFAASLMHVFNHLELNEGKLVLNGGSFEISSSISIERINGSIDASARESFVYVNPGESETISLPQGMFSAPLWGIQAEEGDVVINDDITVYGILTSSNYGVFTTGDHKIILPQGANPDFSGGGWVNGKLQRTLAEGENIFDIGTNVYTPVIVNATNVIGEVNLTIRSSQGNPPAGSGISQSAKTNHFWTIEKTGNGSFGTCDITFDLSNTNNTGNIEDYIVRQFNDGVWTNAVSTISGNTITVAGLTGFGDFVIGELDENCVPTIATQPIGEQIICANETPRSLSVIANGSGLTYQWYIDYGGAGFNGDIIAGATNPTYIPSIAAGSTFYYAVIKTNCGSVTSGYSRILINPGDTWYQDLDNDGFGDLSVKQISCVQPPGYVADSTDCNDNNPQVWRSGRLYFDFDRDGITQGSTIICYGATIPFGFVLTENGDDCDDNNYDIHESFNFYIDMDGDGFGDGVPIGRCALNANTPPSGYVLMSNGIDCNDNDPSVHQSFLFYIDTDGDGYGTGDAVNLCAVDANTPPFGYSTNNTDNCPNTSNPDQADVNNNGIGDACENSILINASLFPFTCPGSSFGLPLQVSGIFGGDNIFTAQLSDANGSFSNPTLVGSVAATTSGNIYLDLPANLAAGTGYRIRVVSSNPVAISPSIGDLEIKAMVTYYRDADGDGYGTPAIQLQNCFDIPGYVTNGNDCNDADASIHPGAVEICNGIDDDCDGLIDEGCPANLPRITIANVSTTEGNTGMKELKFVVRLSATYTSAIQVKYTTIDSTTTEGDDYIKNAGTLTIAAGRIADTVRVLVNGDARVEPNEYFNVQLSNPVNAKITTGRAAGTIRNDDTYPALIITNYTITEGSITDSTLLVKLRLSKRYPDIVTVTYSTEDSTATSGIDYVPANGTATFNPGDTLAYIPVTIKADRIDEPNEIININLSNIVNATAAANLHGRITINDDDLLPQLIFTNVSIAEGSSEIFTNTVFTVRLNRSYPLPVSIAYTTQDSTATSGSDYQLTSGTLTFEPGDTLETITIPVYGDRIAESNEIIKLQFSNAMNATVATTPYRITITNDDVLPQIVFANSSIAEGSNDQFTSQDFTIRLNKSYPLPVTVNYSTQDSSAVSGSDYQAVNGTITFMPGDTLETISIPVLGDRVVEPGEIIKLVFSDATNATITATAYRITITNDDAYPAVTITNISVTEGDAGFVNAAFAVRINKQYPQNITVQYATQDATAIAGLDYTAANGTVTFPADGDLLQVVNIPVSGDLIDEVNETFKLQLSLPSNATISGTGAATATITDNDPVPAIRVYDTIATEASGNASLRVALNSVSGREVKVVYKTQEGSALDTLDYIRIAADTLVFQPGETQKYINVTVLADATVEGNETFSVILQSPVNATVTASQGGDNTGVVTIQNSTGSGSRTTNGLIVKNANEDKWIVDTLKVSVSPNPFRFNTLFTVTSPESGDMRIVIFSINGARIAEQKRDVQKGMPVNVYFNDFSPRQGLLIYKIFINGKDKHSGKLIQLN